MTFRTRLRRGLRALAILGLSLAALALLALVFAHTPLGRSKARGAGRRSWCCRDATG